MTAARLAPVLTLQLLWVAGAFAWNVVGVARLEAGQQALGPTASLAAAAFVGVLGLAMALGAWRWRLVYLAGSGLMVLLTGLAVWGAATGVASDWPSAAWRVAGAALNGMGLLAALTGLWLVITARGAG